MKPQYYLRYFFLISFAVLPFLMQGQVQGNAFLMGEVHHPGIRVIFTPISITGQADTVFTDSTGSYQAQIQPGVYEIAFDKTGFNTVQYLAGQSVILTGTDTLQDVTLNTLYYKYISGVLRDTLYADTIYVATGNLTVPGGSHLYLAAGTHLWFEGNFSLTVNGNFDAIGTPSQPVTIGVDTLQYPGLQWREIEIQGGTDTLRMEYCRVHSGEKGIKITNVPFAKIQHNRWSASYDGLWLKGNTSSLFEENEMTTLTGICFRIETQTNTHHQIYCNYFHDAAATGIESQQSYGDIDILSNTFVNMLGIYGGGIDVFTFEGDVLIEDNVVVGSTYGLRLILMDSLLGTTTARHNVFAGNQSGIILRAGAGGAVIQMNAILNNLANGVIQPYPPGGTPGEFSYNLVGGNPTDYSTVNITGIGVNITSNINGTPCDAYLNISDPGSYAPLISVLPGGTTPLTNAGNPAAPLEADSSVADIGIRPNNYCFTFFQGYNALVYPGDANYNQVANVWDLLPIGQYFGASGPARSSSSLSWQGQPAADWGSAQANGEDLKHVDCNGDGLINAQDTTAILQNYQAVHQATSKRTSANGVPLYLDMPTQASNPGDTLIVPIHLGKIDTPAVNIYGMAFSVTYDSSMMNAESIWVEMDSSWIGNHGTNMISLQKNRYPDEELDIAFTRIDQVDQTGYGMIGNIIIVLDEDIGKTMVPLKLGFRNITASDHAGGELAVAGKAGTTTVDTDPNNTTSLPPLLEGAVNLYPNPSTDLLRVSVPQPLSVLEGKITNIQGQVVQQIPAGTVPNFLKVNTQSLPNGLYLLFLQTDKGLISEKFQVMH